MKRIYISYSHRDKGWYEELMRHISVLLRNYKNIEIVDFDILGQDWNDDIKNELENSDIILILISANFLASGFIYNVDFKKILESPNKYIIPVIIKPVLWQDYEPLRKLKVFPSSDKAIASYVKRDEAYYELVQELKTILDSKLIKEDKDDNRTLLNVRSSESKIINDERFVFISHTHEDGDFAELLKLRLEREGFKVWIDTDRLKIGQVWREEIDDAIKNSIALVVIMTPEARNSEYVTYEWAYAWGARVKILPIQLKLTQFHPRLESLQFLDFTHREARPWERLIQAVKSGI